MTDITWCGNMVYVLLCYLMFNMKITCGEKWVYFEVVVNAVQVQKPKERSAAAAQALFVSLHNHKA